MCDMTDYECAYSSREEHVGHLCVLRNKMKDIFDDYHISEKDQGKLDILIEFIREETNVVDRYDNLLSTLKNKENKTKDSNCVFDNLYL